MVCYVNNDSSWEDRSIDCNFKVRLLGFLSSIFVKDFPNITPSFCTAQKNYFIINKEMFSRAVHSSFTNLEAGVPSSALWS